MRCTLPCARYALYAPCALYALYAPCALYPPYMYELSLKHTWAVCAVCDAMCVVRCNALYALCALCALYAPRAL